MLWRVWVCASQRRPSSSPKKALPPSMCKSQGLGLTTSFIHVYVPWKLVGPRECLLASRPDQRRLRSASAVRMLVPQKCIRQSICPNHSNHSQTPWPPATREVITREVLGRTMACENPQPRSQCCQGGCSARSPLCCARSGRLFQCYHPAK